jgi:hypothetical protein
VVCVRRNENLARRGSLQGRFGGVEPVEGWGENNGAPKILRTAR